MFKRIFKLKHGFSLTELAISMGITAVLIGGIYAGRQAIESAKIARAAQDIATLREAAHMWLAENGKTDFSGAGDLLSKLKTPRSWSNVNPWGGYFYVEGGWCNNDGGQVLILIGNPAIPADAWTALQNRFKNSYDKTFTNSTWNGFCFD